MGGSHPYWIDGGLEVCMMAGCDLWTCGERKAVSLRRPDVRVCFEGKGD